MLVRQSGVISFATIPKEHNWIPLDRAQKELKRAGSEGKMIRDSRAICEPTNQPHPRSFCTRSPDR